MNNTPSTGILCVCLGNICRSPTAHGILRRLVQDAGLANHIRVDSAGTGDWHLGAPPDQRSAAAAARRGYQLGDLRARQVEIADFYSFDFILAMDRYNLEGLEALRPEDFQGHLGLFMDYGNGGVREVPDPYNGGPQGFEKVLDLLENASRGLLAQLARPANAPR